MSPLRALPFVVALLLPRPAAAELTGAAARMPSRLYAQTGYERSLGLLTLGYAYDLDARTVEVPASIYVEARAGVASFEGPSDVDRGGLRLGLRFELVRIARFAVPLRAGVGVDVDLEPERTHVRVQTDVIALPGFYDPRGSLALELGLQSTWAELSDSHVQGELDTWGHVSVQQLRLGVRAGVIVAPRLELALRAGYDDAHDVRELVPTYADITAAVRF